MAWLTQPARAGLPTASRAEVLWLALSLGGLCLTLWNLGAALAARHWQQRHAPRDLALGEVALAGVWKAWGFVGVDAVCVVIGVAAVANWRTFPLLLVVGLLLVRLLLPAIALRDLRLRRRVFGLGLLRDAPLPGEKKGQG